MLAHLHTEDQENPGFVLSCKPFLKRPPEQGIYSMSYMNMGDGPAYPDESTQDELEQFLLHGPLTQHAAVPAGDHQAFPHPSYTPLYNREEEEEEEGIAMNSDVQGALGLYAEATQDLATAGLELALGRHFACADYCNQAVEKAAQAVNLFHQGHRTMYNHDLRALGAAVGAPVDVQDDMATLTPFHPEAFYAQTPPEVADEAISAEEAREHVQTARRVLRWARGIIL
jgi:HEPN domain-containing protein